MTKEKNDKENSKKIKKVEEQIKEIEERKNVEKKKELEEIKTSKKEEMKKLTVKERINNVVNEYKDDKEELKEELFLLIQRILYPNQFCPDCKDRLFYGKNGWSCPNCGYTRPADVPITQQSPNQPNQSKRRPSQGGEVPPEVDNAIAEANKKKKNPRRDNNPTKKGKDIRKLVDRMKTGGSNKPTKADKANVRKDPNVGRNINWV